MAGQENLLRVPWRARKLGSDVLSAAHYGTNLLVNRSRLHAGGKRRRLQFLIPFYGYTGGSFMTLSVANLLADDFLVSYRSHATNVMNKFVSRGVILTRELDDSADVCVVEGGEDFEIIDRLRQNGTRIIVTMHGLPPTPDGLTTHGYEDDHIAKVMNLSTSIQYITELQQPAVDNFGHVHHRLIRDFVWRVEKSTRTRNVGIVCDTTLKRKNIAVTLRSAELSEAERIHVWGRYESRMSTERVHWHGFGKDKNEIFGSFDVLVHLSLVETQALVVLEAMSAGIPSVIADLPVYNYLAGVEGIWMVDPHDPEATAVAINEAFNCSAAVREGLRRHWERHHSPAVIRRQWIDYIDTVMEQPL